MNSSNYLGFVYKEVFGDIRLRIGNYDPGKYAPEDYDRIFLYYFDQLVEVPEDVGYDSFTVTYKNLDGTDDAVFTVPANAPMGDALLVTSTRQGYNFGYWTTKPNDGTPVTKTIQLTNPNTTVLELLPATYGTPVTKVTRVTSNIDLYALYVGADSYVVVWDANGGRFNSNIPAANGGGGTAPIVRAVTSPNTSLDQNGYELSAGGYPGIPELGPSSFDGWCDNLIQAGNRYNSGQWNVKTAWEINKSLILYANWAW
jgi:hypothetical protein